MSRETLEYFRSRVPRAQPRDVVEREVVTFLASMAERGLVKASPEFRPYTLVAELTYKCPLRCVYCSNPLDYGRRARAVAAVARLRLRGKMEILFVTPDYYSGFPKACMDGWERRFLVVSPDGLVLPCHAAHTLPGLEFENVRQRALGDIWRDSPGFNAFRGEAWMPEPCRSYDRRTIDFGGCRCQAFHLTGNAAVTDPACRLSPDHGLIEAARAHALETARTEVPFKYRSSTTSLRG